MHHMLKNIKPVIYTPQKLCEAFFWTKTNKILEQAQVNLIYQDSEDFKMNRIKRIHVNPRFYCMLYHLKLELDISSEKL